MKDFPAKLFACWHPVAYSHEVTDKPMGSKLLNEHLVLWRTSDGQPHAMKDLCIHRGTALSLGWVADECIVCPYHGWRYNSEGACVLIRQRANSDDTLALDMIAQVGPGGHHFGTSHTQARYQSEFYAQFLADRQNYETWQQQGATDAAQRANKIWKDILKYYEQPPLDEAIHDELKEFVERRMIELDGVELYS